MLRPRRLRLGSVGVLRSRRSADGRATVFRHAGMLRRPVQPRMPVYRSGLYIGLSDVTESVVIGHDS